MAKKKAAKKAKKNVKKKKAAKKVAKKASKNAAKKPARKKTAKKAKKAKKAVSKKQPAKKTKKAKKAKKVAKKVSKKKVAGKKAKTANKAKKVSTKKALAKKAKALPAQPTAQSKKAKKAAPASKPQKPELASTEVLDDDLDLVDESGDEPEVVLTDAEGRMYCRVRDCDQSAVVEGYCRYHYLLLWKRIQVRKKILSEGKLGRYIEELTSKYPDKFLEVLRKDLRSEKDFLVAIQELEIDEGNDDSFEEEDTRNYINEVRGIETSSRDDDDY